MKFLFYLKALQQKKLVYIFWKLSRLATMKKFFFFVKKLYFAENLLENNLKQKSFQKAFISKKSCWQQLLLVK